MAKSKQFSELEKRQDHARICRDFAVRARDALANLMKFDKDGDVTDFFDTCWDVTKGDEGVTLGLPELTAQAEDLCKHLQEEYEEATEKVDFEKKKLKQAADMSEMRRGPGPQIVRPKRIITKIVGYENVDGLKIPIKKEIEEDDTEADWKLVYGMRRGPAMAPPQPEILPFLVRKDRSKHDR